MFSEQALTWPKMSGSWGKQKNALYQLLHLSLSSPTSDLIHQSVQRQDEARRTPVMLFIVCIKSERQVFKLTSTALGFDLGLWHCTEKPTCAAVWKRQHQKESKKKLYQVEFHIPSIMVPILMPVQQNTLNELFLNTTYTKHVKPRINISSDIECNHM